MSISILATADWHLGERKGPVRDGVNLRGLDTIERVEEVIAMARTTKPDIVMMSGDVIDKPEVYGKRALDDEITAERLLSELADCTKHLIVLRGTPNHDGLKHFEGLREHFHNRDNVHIVMEPAVIRTDKMDVACLPGFDRGYFRAKHPDVRQDNEVEVFSAALNEIVLGLRGECSAERPMALMAHYYVPGTDTGGSGGNYIQKFEPSLSPEILNAVDFDLVALGHIHRPQKLSNVKNCFYAGGINRFTFGDEDGERGFYMHTINDDRSVDSRFIPVKAREFRTIRLDNDDISAINAGMYDFAAQKWIGQIDDAVVRVRYTCSRENNAALNRAELVKRLNEDGAFYVAEDIICDDITEEVDRKSLGIDADPEANLVEYLTRKEMKEEEINRLVELARPIIAKCMTDVTAASMQGTFVPVRIEVENYRNYVKESFDFTDVTFCTINGDNGVGKSSLFEDAIVDCLYEEPREGGGQLSKDCPWIRNGEDATSGSIIFTFKIGEKTFRVTRKRAKSGGLKLNVAEEVDGEWVNRSEERATETQKKLLQILGMDSLTFKSCAMIMQDQYGLFLQAKPEDRMSVLSSLLGLGIYASMQKVADDRRSEASSAKKEIEKEISVLEEGISKFGNPKEEIDAAQAMLSEKEKSLTELEQVRETKALQLHTLKDAEERVRKLTEDISAREVKKAGAEAEKSRQLTVMTECDATLSQEQVIRENAEACRNLEAKEKELIEAKTLYVTKQAALSQKNAEEAKIKADLMRAKAEEEQEEARLLILKDDSGDEEIRIKAEEYDKKLTLYDEMKNLQIRHQQMKNELAECEADLKAVVAERLSAMKALEAEQAVLEKKTELLKSSGCVDVENANCRFLQDAKAAEEQLKEIPARREAINAKYGPVIENFETVVKQHESEVESLGYHQDAMEIIQRELVALKPYKDKAAELQKKALEISALEAALEAKGTNIESLTERLLTVKGEGTALASEVEQYKTAYEESITVQARLASLRPWIEKEQQLPVLKERKANAVQRFTELDVQIREIETEINEKKAERDAEVLKTIGIDEKKREVQVLDAEISRVTALIGDIRQQIGGLQQKLEDMKAKKQKITELSVKKTETAETESDYEVLKKSFTSTGIPRQIILNVLPVLAETANTILGQMTGGKMGIDFRTEKENTLKREKATLDVLITEFGKGTLPYLSRSGGEKVKASLAVILALAEIKSSAAGMQLGVLCIDESPFLDPEGVQAYCDALQAIQTRYPNKKVMAITHDPVFKARFPQSITVTKDDTGSHVSWDR